MNSTPPIAYPLHWPFGWPVTELTRRAQGTFKTSLPAALQNLKREIQLMGGKNVVLSSNYTLGAENPRESGVCAYFDYDGMNLAIPCDRWFRIEHNVQAIALTVGAMRGMKRWGANQMIRAMFTGFKALPAGQSKPHWSKVLGVAAMAGADLVQAAYRDLVKKHHPDVGGDPNQFREVQEAYEDYVHRFGEPKAAR